MAANLSKNPVSPPVVVGHAVQIALLAGMVAFGISWLGGRAESGKISPAWVAFLIGHFLGLFGPPAVALMMAAWG